MAVHITRRAFLIGAGAAASTAALAACGTPGSNAPAEGDSAQAITEIVYLTNSDDLSSRDVVQRWNAANADLQVDLRQSESGTYGENFPRLATSTDAPNIAGYFIDGGLFTDLAQAGALADLTGFWESEGLNEAIPPLIRDRYFNFTSDGKVYGVPTNTSRYGCFFYRKSVLAAAGVAEPVDHEWASLAEFEAACDTLLAAGVEPISVGGKDGYPLSHIQDGLLASTMPPEMIDAPREIDYTSEAWKAPVVKMLDWNNRGYFARGFLGRSTDQGNTLFGQGGAGFNTGMNVWQPLMIEAGVPLEDLDWCLLPPLGDLPTKLSIYAGGGFVIPTIAAGRDQTLTFASFLISPEEALKGAEEGQAIPGRNDIDGLQAALGPIGGSMFDFADQEGRSQFGWDDAAPSDMIAYDRTNLQAVLAGTLTVDDFSAELERLKSA